MPSLGIMPRKCTARNCKCRDVAVRAYVLSVLFGSYVQTLLRHVAEGRTDMGKQFDTTFSGGPIAEH